MFEFPYKSTTGVKDSIFPPIFQLALTNVKLHKKLLFLKFPQLLLGS